MLISVIFQIIVIGGYRFSVWLTPVEHFVKPPPQDTIIIGTWSPPIDWGAHEIISVDAIKLAKGIPLPVPDAIVDTSIEFASQKNLSQIADADFNHIAEGLDKGTIIAPPDQNDMPAKQLWQVEIQPKPILTPKPEYPELAIRINLEGSAIVNALLDTEGRVKKTILMKTSDEIFAQPALDAAQKWVFTPAIMNGKPVRVWVSIPFSFRLIH